MLLTKSTMPIIGWIASLMGIIMEYIFKVLDAVGIQNIGLCIIIFTIIIRVLLLPLMVRQQKFTKINQAMQPEINKIQKKYRNKKDQASMMKQNEEIQAVYDKYGTSPTGGCAQMLVQFPVLLALYQVIRNPAAYIPQVKLLYESVVNAISGQAGYIDKINNIAEGLNSSYVKALSADATTNQVIDVLNYFKAETWTELANAFPSVADTIQNISTEIIHMNDFALGMNITQIPGWKPSIYWLIPILAGLFQYLSIKTMKTPQTDDQTANMTKSMNLMMPLMSVYFCVIMPTGLGLYWIISAMFQCIQQIAINAYLDRADLDKMIEKNRAKAAKKKAKGKKSFMERLTDTSGKAEDAKQEYNNQARNNSITNIASMNLRKISSPASLNSSDLENMESKDFDALGEISKNAYLVNKYDKEHSNRGGK